jgi:hypothetical protein
MDFNRRETLVLMAGVAIAPMIGSSSSAQVSQKPEAPTRNPFLADSNYCMVHANSAQTDSTVDPGPVGTTRQLAVDEMRYHDLGMWNLLYLVSSPYADGKRVIWTNGSQYMTKLDYDTFDIIAKLRMSSHDHFDGLAHEEFIDIFDSDASFDEKLAAAKRSGMPPVEGIYTMLDVDNQYVVAGEGFVRIYGDTEPGDRLSGIEIKKQWDQPKDITGSFMGMNMTYDGRIVLATTDGFVLTLARDFSEVKSVRLPHAVEEVPNVPAGVLWVRNGFSVDEKGGIYVASNQHLHKVIWNGTALSVDAKDGAWSEPFGNSLGRGTGSTPTLVGFGNEPDKLVVLTDGDVLMNVVAYWRDDIPSDWKQIDGAPSPRVAGQQPANFGDPNLKAAQSEQSMVCSGYGMFVVNNEMVNVPQEILDDAHTKKLFIGYLSYLKEYAPHGGEKFEWDPASKTLKSAWVNTEVTSPNCVPMVSTGSNLVYLCGARDDKWTLEAMDWKTGKSAFHFVMGGARFNSFYSQPQIDMDGRVLVSGLYGALRIQPKAGQ